MDTMTMPEDKMKVLDKISKTYEELQNKLSPDLFELLQKHISAQEESWCNEIDFYFVEGFKLGLQIGVECMDE